MVIKVELKDILDMEDYLNNRCYCPYEIYESSGFCYQIFEPSEECVVLGSVNSPTTSGEATIALSKDQILVIFFTNGVIDDVIRFDATPNNIDEFKKLLDGYTGALNLNHFDGKDPKQTLKDILAMSNGIVIRD